MDRWLSGIGTLRELAGAAQSVVAESNGGRSETKLDGEVVSGLLRKSPKVLKDSTVVRRVLSLAEQVGANGASCDNH
ncbi:hypothetical protein [Streptomyces sp. CL12]|uniref:hypothetical protein n=1 Tax=Streptomyces sp. CL12 TaxID=3391744 RepID=UPI003A800C2F